MNPLKLFKIKNGHLLVGGVSISDIVKKTGSPLYIYDAQIMERQYKKLKSSIPKSVDIHYSVKANPNQAIANIFFQMGAGAEVASKSELAMSLKTGLAPSKIIFAGPGKSKDELNLAIKKEIGLINVESETELENILQIAKRKKVKIAFRVNLDFGKTGKGESEIMAGGPRKFGTDSSAVEPLIRKAISSDKVDFKGFHFFAGTQIRNTVELVTAYRKYASWAQKIAEKLQVNVEVLNFGGGLGIPFKGTDKELDVKKLGDSLKKITSSLSKHPLFKNVKFILEPGRYLVGPSGIYIAKVTDIKVSCKKTYVITDGGLHHAIIPIVINKNYPSEILNKMGKRKTKDITVAGPLCASADQFSRTVRLPKPEIGDIIGIFNSGAYGYTAGMVNFLSHPTPPEILSDKGKIYLVRAPKKPEHGTMKKISL